MRNFERKEKRPSPDGGPGRGERELVRTDVEELRIPVERYFDVDPLAGDVEGPAPVADPAVLIPADVDFRFGLFRAPFVPSEGRWVEAVLLHQVGGEIGRRRVEEPVRVDGLDLVPEPLCEFCRQVSEALGGEEESGGLVGVSEHETGSGDVARKESRSVFRPPFSLCTEAEVLRRRE